MAKPYGRIYNNNKNVSITPLDIKDLYPVGSIYLTVSDIYPGDYFGGTWVKMSGGFLYGSASSAGGQSSITGTNTGSGGATATGSTTLTINQIPGHTHNFPAYHVNAGSYNAEAAELTYKDWGTTAWPAVSQSWGQSTAGGGQGHTHPMSTHTHAIPYIGVWIWKRTA